MAIWEVLGKRTEGDEFAVVGGLKAPDAEMALLLARETHFRHKEGVAYAVRRRGEPEVHRRQEGYVGVGATMKRVHRELAAKGLVIDRPRPPAGRTRSAEAEHADA